MGEEGRADGWKGTACATGAQALIASQPAFSIGSFTAMPAR